MGGLFNPPKPFMQLNAWQAPNLNQLQYNTSVAGTVVPLVYGTVRQGINLLAFGNYMGPGGGKKGKGVGPLPISGTDISTAKGGGGGSSSKKGTGKKSGNYSIDVDFGVCQGPVDIGPFNFAFAGGDAAYFMSIGLNLYTGEDGQAPDPTFDSLGDVIGYSGLCHVTGTPLNLGQSPVLPNIQFEVSGFFAGTAWSGSPDARPDLVIADFLTNARYGCGFPAAYLDDDITADFGDYCQAAGLVISISLNGQTEAQESLGAVCKLLNTAICWSDSVLKFIPYGDVALNANGISWAPDLTPVYSLTDDHFLPWEPHIADDGTPQENKEDPIVITRSSPADAVNYMTIEYLDRSNFYNATTYAVFDQGSIDQYGTRTGENLQGHMFCTAQAAQTSAQILMQRLQYIRNSFKFIVGWQFALLELMDIVLLTENISGLVEFPVRITSIEENDNGDLTIEAEEIQVSPTPMPAPPSPCNSILDWVAAGGGDTGGSGSGVKGYTLDDIGDFLSGGGYIITNGGALQALLVNSDFADDIDLLYGSGTVNRTGVYSPNTPLIMVPLFGGEYILATMETPNNGFTFRFWFGIYSPGSPPVLRGAVYWVTLTGIWEYGFNQAYATNTQTADDPILILGAPWPAMSLTLGMLPSVSFITGSGGGGEVPYAAYEYIGSPEISGAMIQVTLAPNTIYGFTLPDSKGGTNFYVYFGKYIINNSIIANPLAAAYPDGCIIKVPLGVLTYGGGGDLGPTTYSVDNANWFAPPSAPQIPFTDEYTYISNGESGGDDSYQTQPLLVTGEGRYWTVGFVMVGNADSHDNLGDAIHWGTVRLFEYDADFEVSRMYFKQSCILYTTAAHAELTQPCFSVIGNIAGSGSTLYAYGTVDTITEGWESFSTNFMQVPSS